MISTRVVPVCPVTKASFSSLPMANLNQTEMSAKYGLPVACSRAILILLAKVPPLQTTYHAMSCHYYMSPSVCSLELTLLAGKQIS
jgi:hypothetical protein